MRNPPQSPFEKGGGQLLLSNTLILSWPNGYRKVFNLLKYNRQLKSLSRQLRSNMTDSEQLLWSRLRRKQVLGVQFYRQKPIRNYIVDFYAPRVKLVVEVDGSQHCNTQDLLDDKQRDACMNQQGLQVLRFNNLQVLQELDAVMDVVFRAVESGIDQ